ncbi:peptidoglycan DD-metalloendopeptidase family protein [Flavobacterium agricola]|uniref:Peptidoglycan DD-metalloendopeptidase family protein n=1 Tax=Flavobacterium agricola TaxID=2870839 RepID=A0ABY6LZY7_9FLAO|nr:peptidoglycan DD-metalloendopeptidase family protein [Flavobacterium agricola]UYW01137.1 peptidoglycan DD-metalloendopeptidase family protein [Flavobacterium agricola]
MKYLYVFLAAALLVGCGEEKKEEIVQQVVVEKPKEEIRTAFGFVLNDFEVKHDTIVSGDSFGKILGQNNFSAAQIHEVNEKVKTDFNTRQIRIGKPYTLLKDKNTDSLKVFIYQQDKLHYTVIDLRDSVRVTNNTVPTVLKERVIAGELQGSLSESLNKLGVQPGIATELSNIYAWSIDFFKLDKGNKFALSLTERFLEDGEYVGVESINGSFIEYRGKLMYSFPHKKSESQRRPEYYDEEGKQMKSMFLKAPLKFFRITSKFTKQRFHPVQLKWKAHNGTDYAAPHGTEIMTTAAGTVIETGYTAGNGNYVKVKHNGTYTTQYLHMSKILVKKGQHVAQGEVIGRVGSTGLATGPHVCYRFWKNGVQVDPLSQALPSADPMDKKELPGYLAKINPIKQQLDSVATITFRDKELH